MSVETRLFPAYAWGIGYDPPVDMGDGRRRHGIGGYCESCGGALAKITKHIHKNTVCLFVQYQDIETQDEPLIHFHVK